MAVVLVVRTANGNVNKVLKINVEKGLKGQGENEGEKEENNE